MESIDSHCSAPGNLSSEHGEREGEAGYPPAGGGFPGEGATRVPLVASSAGFERMGRQVLEDFVTYHLAVEFKSYRLLKSITG
jgi:hypothetical protein